MLRSTTTFIESGSEGTDTDAKARELLATQSEAIERLLNDVKAYAKNRRQALDGIADQALRRSAER